MRLPEDLLDAEPAKKRGYSNEYSCNSLLGVVLRSVAT